MKKLLILFITLFTAIPVFSMEVDLTKVGHQQKYINEIGFRILNANKIEKRTNFYYEPNRKTVNTWSRLTDRQITVTQGMLAYVDSEDEMAALLSHEISHSVDSYDGAFKGYFSTFKYSLSSKKYETKADKRAVDYMVKAGYNPVAIIVLYNKFMSQTRYDYYLTHPLTSRRMATVYEYIYRKYPAYLANNKYAENIYYQNFLLTSQQNREKLKQSIQTNSKKKIKYN